MRLLCCLPNNCLIEELSPGGQVDNLQCWRTQRGRQQLLTLENATWWPPSGIRASSKDHTRLSSLGVDLDEISFKYQVTTWPFQKSWKPGEPESSISSIWQTTQWSWDATPKPTPDSGRERALPRPLEVRTSTLSATHPLFGCQRLAALSFWVV